MGNRKKKSRHKPDNARRIVPFLTVSAPGVSLAFYTSAFGFKPEHDEIITHPNGEIVHASMRYKGKTVVMFAPEGAWSHPAKTPKHTGQPCPVGLYVYCDNVDMLYETALRHGAIANEPPSDAFWGDRVARLDDPDGYTWTFATHVGRFAPLTMPGLEDEAAEAAVE
ncbi:MAG: VOC family protein [Thiotrichales bacterium]